MSVKSGIIELKVQSPETLMHFLYGNVACMFPNFFQRARIIFLHGPEIPVLPFSNSRTPNLPALHFFARLDLFFFVEIPKDLR